MIYSNYIICLLHSKGIAHRDIKLENILLDLNNIVKICDFVVGKITQKGQKLLDQCGTPVYMAPEIVQGDGYEGFPVDVWSAGVALYIMLSGNIPFNRDKTHDLIALHRFGHYINLMYKLEKKDGTKLALTTTEVNISIIQEASIAASDYFTLLDREVKIDKSGPTYRPPRDSIMGRIEFKNIEFIYPSDVNKRKVLDGLNLVFEPGQKVGGEVLIDGVKYKMIMNL